MKYYEAQTILITIGIANHKRRLLDQNDVALIKD